LIEREFEIVCDKIHKLNTYGKTSTKSEYKYSSLWTAPLLERLVDKLKVGYPDSKIILDDFTIIIDWALDNDVSDEPNDTVNVKTTENDKDIQINITMPSHIVTRSSARKLNNNTTNTR
jgi:hypothetical protein